MDTFEQTTIRHDSDIPAQTPIIVTRDGESIAYDHLSDPYLGDGVTYCEGQIDYVPDPWDTWRDRVWEPAEGLTDADIRELSEPGTAWAVVYVEDIDDGETIGWTVLTRDITPESLAKMGGVAAHAL